MDLAPLHSQSIQPEKAMTSRRPHPSRDEKVPPRDTNDDSGSTGHKPGKGGNTGQDQYGQSGYGQGGYGQDKDGQPPHKGEEDGSSGTSDYGNSNFGSGRAERDESQTTQPGEKQRKSQKRERP
jgi:hypothetical protein